MRLHLTVSCVLFGLCVGAFAQTKIRITLPDKGDRQIWTAPSSPSGPPDAPIEAKDDSASIDVKPGDTRIFVLDTKTGNLAETDVKKLSGDAWKLSAGDFDKIWQVKVHVDHAGTPVAAAQVELGDGHKNVGSLLTPSDKGDVSFYAVTPGHLKVTVRYKSQGHDATPLKQEFDQPLARSDAAPTLAISIPGEVDTAASPPADSKPAPTPGPSANPFGAIVVYLFGLALAIAVGYFALMYAKRNSPAVASKLEQLGVQIPKPGDAAQADPGPAPVPIQPAPTQKIILDDAQPDPMPAPIPSNPVANPRLVSSGGEQIPLNEGELVVGRDPDAGLSLATEQTISRKHAKLTRSGPEVTVTDLGSTNGTFLNGAPLSGEATLRPGDEVRFGAVAFRFEG